jgi:hypothetical protein
MSTRALRIAHLMLLALALAACRRMGPDVNMSVSPRYPCQGDSVTLTFSSTNVDKIEVRDARGKDIAQASGPSGAVTIPHIDPAMLPLVATTRRDNQSRVQHIPGEIPLSVIDRTTATESFVLDHKLLAQEKRTRIGAENCGCTLDDDGAPLLCEAAAPIYEVSGTYEGQDRLLESAWFSPRAHVVGMVNHTPFALTFFHNDNRIVSVPPGTSQKIDYASEVMPAGRWSGKYESNNLQIAYTGTYVDGGKVCTGWIHRPTADVSRNVSLALLLRCME